MIQGDAVLENREHDGAFLPLSVSPHKPSFIHDLQVKAYQNRTQKDRGYRVMKEFYPVRFSAAC